MSAIKFQIKDINHHQITRVMFLVLLAFIISTGLVLGIYSQTLTAQATIGMSQDYGTFVASVALPTLSGTGVCPPHVVVFDMNSSIPKLIGITNLESPTNINPLLVYANNNLFTPGVWTLGEYAPIPIPTCGGFPYEVYACFINPESGLCQLGTGDIPGY